MRTYSGYAEASQAALADVLAVFDGCTMAQQAHRRVAPADQQRCPPPSHIELAMLQQRRQEQACADGQLLPPLPPELPSDGLVRMWCSLQTS